MYYLNLVFIIAGIVFIVLSTASFPRFRQLFLSILRFPKNKEEYRSDNKKRRMIGIVILSLGLFLTLFFNFHLIKNYTSDDIIKLRDSVNIVIQKTNNEIEILDIIIKYSNLELESIKHLIDVRDALQERKSKAEKLSFSYEKILELPEDTLYKLLKDSRDLIVDIKDGIATGTKINEIINTSKEKWDKMLRSSMDSVKTLVAQHQVDARQLRQYEKLLEDKEEIIAGLQETLRDKNLTINGLKTIVADQALQLTEKDTIIKKLQEELDQIDTVTVIYPRITPQFAGKITIKKDSLSDCYRIKNVYKVLGVKLFTKNKPLIIKDTTDFRLKRGVGKIRVFVSCTPPPGSELIDTKKEIINGIEISYTEAIDIEEGSEKNKPVQFTLKPGFKGGNYIIRYYSQFNATPLREIPFKICR